MSREHCIGKVYLGDAVYVSNDGWGIELTTEDGVSVTNSIYLEPQVWDGLLRYVRALAGDRRAEESEGSTA